MHSRTLTRGISSERCNRRLPICLFTLRDSGSLMVIRETHGKTNSNCLSSYARHSVDSHISSHREIHVGARIFLVTPSFVTIRNVSAALLPLLGREILLLPSAGKKLSALCKVLFNERLLLQILLLLKCFRYEKGAECLCR